MYYICHFGTIVLLFAFLFFQVQCDDSFTVTPIPFQCDPECVHGVCNENTLLCDCPVFYEGDSCDTLTFQSKLIVSVVLLLIALCILCYLCNKNKSQKKTLPPVVEDPFIHTLRSIVSDEASRQIHIGDRYSSRDSYINSQTTRKERWWRPKTRYSVVNTAETSP